MTEPLDIAAVDLAVQYVMGELPPDEARAFEHRFGADPALAAEVQRLRGALGLVAYATVTEPPPDLRARVLAAGEAAIRSEQARWREAETPAARGASATVRAAAEPPARPIADRRPPSRAAGLATRAPHARPARRVVWSRFAAAAAAALALAFGLDSWRVRRELTLERELAVALLEPNVVHSFRLAGTGAAGDGYGTVKLDMDAKKGAVVLKNMPQLAAGQVYRLWAQVADKAVPCGDFKTRPDGSVLAQFPVPVESYTAPLGKLFVTVEPDAGGTTPTGPQVMESV